MDSLYDYNYPPLDVFIDEETKDLHLEFAMAGIPLEDIRLNIDGDYLLLDADKREDSIEGKKMIQKGIKKASFHNKYMVPAGRYNLKDVKAKKKDGLLIIDIPALEETRPRQISITEE